jgi:hypothetical protein
MNSLIDNPIAQMYGSHFLVLYGFVIGVTLIACKFSLAFLDQTSKRTLLTIPHRPNPYKIAYLRGDREINLKRLILKLLNSLFERTK